jgi:hypothetical protein
MFVNCGFGSWNINQNRIHNVAHCLKQRLMIVDSYDLGRKHSVVNQIYRRNISGVCEAKPVRLLGSPQDFFRFSNTWWKCFKKETRQRLLTWRLWVLLFTLYYATVNELWTAVGDLCIVYLNCTGLDPGIVVDVADHEISHVLRVNGTLHSISYCARVF